MALPFHISLPHRLGKQDWLVSSWMCWLLVLLISATTRPDRLPTHSKIKQDWIVSKHFHCFQVQRQKVSLSALRFCRVAVWLFSTKACIISWKRFSSGFLQLWTMVAPRGLFLTIHFLSRHNFFICLLMLHIHASQKNSVIFFLTYFHHILNVMNNIRWRKHWW